MSAQKFDRGYIKVHRSLKSWEWYDDMAVKSVFLHCLLMANYEPKEWHGIVIQRGQFVTSRSSLAAELKMSERQIRTALSKLEQTGEIIKKSTSLYTIITVDKYEDFQCDDRITDQPATSDRPATDQPATSDRPLLKKDKKDKKDKNNSILSEFEQLWAAYPNKKGKDAALRAYTKARESGTTFDEVMAGIEAYKSEIKAKKTEQAYIKHGSTWFNQHCWADDYGGESNGQHTEPIIEYGLVLR